MGVGGVSAVKGNSRRNYTHYGGTILAGSKQSVWALLSNNQLYYITDLKQMVHASCESDNIS